ncbi:ABC transporter ATP-binding protein [Helcococcus ovis]|uniref:ABC transporter ATP-binding protein n=1 Tax=Helcococcus ovis TaxID=72026 RepID=UPI0038BA5487
MKKKNTGISYVFQLAKGEKNKLNIGMFLSVISSVLSLVPYFIIYKILLMILQKNTSYTEIIMYAGIGILSAILQAILMSFAGILSHTAAFNTIHEIKIKVVNHISKFNLGFFQEHSLGEIKTLLFDDVDRVENFLAHSTLELAQAFTVPIVMFVFMLKLNWMMALVMLIPMVLGLGIPMILMKNYPDMSDELAKDIGDLNSSANEFIKAMPVIKMYHLTAEKFEQYRSSLHIYIECWKKMCMSSCYPLSITLVVLDSAILFTLPFGGYFFLNNSLSAPDYLLFIMLTMCFFVSFLNMVTIFMQSMELGSGLDNIKKIIDMETLKGGTKTLELAGNFDITFENVSFNYGSRDLSKDALSNINLNLKPNTITAFVGASGAGKTTAAQLIGRYWDVTGGVIKINGTPIQELKIENLMDLTSFVVQDVFLLEDTLYENIRMGINASKEEIIKAAKAAQIHDFILSLPKGYETKIGDAGVKLSGGQQQRVSIARAILKNAPIIIFDEATSYSDIENEYQIQLALESLLKNKTIIMVAHRLHTIKNADQIVVFDNGIVVERGKHNDLLNQKGVYKKMWDTYTKDYVGEEMIQNA